MEEEFDECCPACGAESCAWELGASPADYIAGLISQLTAATERAEKAERQNGVMRRALEMYADEQEWTGKPWRLLFNSSHMDGDGWDTARAALKEVDDE